MTPEQKAKILAGTEEFCRENIGNRLNKWITSSLLNWLSQELGQVVQQDLFKSKDDKLMEKG